MRLYSSVSHQFWIGETGRRLRAAGVEAQVMALYLLTAPSSNMIGLYYLPVPTMAHEIGMTLEGASKALRRVCEEKFALYDSAQEVVFVPEMARYQIGEELSQKDKQVKGVVTQLLLMKKSRFAIEFYEKYRAAYHLDLFLRVEELGSPSEGPSEAHRSQEQEQDQDSLSSSSSLPPSLDLVSSKSKERREEDREQFIEITRRWNVIPGVKVVDAETAHPDLVKRVMSYANTHKGMTWWDTLFARVKQSDFLCGRKTDFQVSLWWVLGPKNLKKVQLGEYDNRSVGTTPMRLVAGDYDDIVER